MPTKRENLQKTDELYARAVSAFDTENLKEAKSLANKCLKIDQREFRALNLLGVILMAEGKYEAAQNAYEQSLKANPTNPQTLNNLANLYAKFDKNRDALVFYKKAIEHDPYFIVARQNYAKTALKLALYDEAISHGAKAFEMDSTDASSLITVGDALKHKKEFGAAEEAFNIAVNYPQSKKEALIELGILKMEQKKLDEALEYFVSVLRIDPAHSASYCNISSILIDKGDMHKARGAITKAIELNPNDYVNYVNLGILLKWENNLEEAKAAFRQALDLEPTNAAAKTNLGLLLMLEGEYKDGFGLYASRPKPILECNKPLYNGEELDGKTILIYHEQGFGDTINFARLLWHPKFKNADVIFAPQTNLVKLFQNSTLQAQIASPEDIAKNMPKFDYHTTLMELLHTLNIQSDKIPRNINYIVDDKDKLDFFASKLSDKKLKIGIAYRGNKDYFADRVRSVYAEEFGTLKLEDAEFVLLQKDPSEDELATLKNSLNIIDMSGFLNDFTDTSALIEHLDLVISVDTSVAHLAATKNKPTWILVADMPDWRWGVSGNMTAWYDSARIFRRKKQDWSVTFELLNDELKKLFI